MSKYLEEPVSVAPITVRQFCQCISKNRKVEIMPSQHRKYYTGECQFVPKELYCCKIIDVSAWIEKDETSNTLDTIFVIYIDEIEELNMIADKEELEAINKHYDYLNLKIEL